MAEPILYTKTLRVKVRSGHAWLDAAAREVNQVWNWANETSYRAASPYSGKPRWLGGFDLNRLATGATAFFEYIGMGTVQEVCEHFAVKRKAAKAYKLRWRISGGTRKSLGWVPFKNTNFRYKCGVVVFAGKRFRIFDSYNLSQYELRSGSFSQDATGDWFLNVTVREPPAKVSVSRSVLGIDLGLKSIATCSDGDTLPAADFYRGLEQKISQAQRRAHKRQAKRLNRKAKNQRKDALHKFTSKLVKENGCIYVGDVSSSKLVKTKMAKAVLDSGWGMLKTMLIAKGQRAGVIVEVVSEKNTTRVCSSCGCFTGPSGLRQLGVRQWRCSECGSEHDRDVNSALNIRAVGLGKQPPSAGTSSGVMQ